MLRKAAPKRLGSRLGSRAVFIAAASLVWGVSIAHAQDLEPRAYSASPIGTNFLTSGFTDTSGSVSLDPSLPITGVKAAIDTYSIGYDHTFGLLGRSASAAIVVPYINGALEGKVYTQNQRVTRSGQGDVRIRLAMNLLGGPALTPAEFLRRQQTTALGVSLIIIAPTGQYDPQRLINISAHRWAFKPEIGLSQPLGNWFAEAYAGAWIFTDNEDYFQGHVFSQDPFYTFQVHGGYNFRPGLWLAADATYYTGGRTSTDGDPAHNYQVNSRYGLTLSVPLAGGFSVKLTWSKLLTGHIGANYQTIGISLQYHWFDRQVPQGH
jgi:Putative MetA-pathway of phenol degradation